MEGGQKKKKKEKKGEGKRERQIYGNGHIVGEE